MERCSKMEYPKTDSARGEGAARLEGFWGAMKLHAYALLILAWTHNLPAYIESLMEVIWLAIEVTAGLVALPFALLAFFFPWHSPLDGKSTRKSPHIR